MRQLRPTTIGLLWAAALAACAGDPEPLFSIGADFEWGTATAAYQIEGGNTTSNWYQFEQRCVLGNEAGHRDGGETITDCQSNLDGPRGWELFDADFAEAQAMGHTAARFGIEWAKIEPQPGVYDAAVIAHYHEVLASARAHGLEPMVTLQHFTLPIWVHDIDAPGSLDGWPGANGSRPGDAPIVEAFGRFCGDMGQEFGADVDLWVTLNEPIVVLVGAYLAGATPPAELLQVGKTLRGAFNMVYAHARCYDALHARDTSDIDADGAAASVSIAQHWRVIDPADPADPDNVEAAAHTDFLFNRLFVDAITAGHRDLNGDGDVDDADEGIDPSLQNRLDWLGVNYYGRQLITDGLAEIDGIRVPLLVAEDPNPALPRNDLGWEIYPAGFIRVLAAAQAYNLPIRVTENGIADEDDDQRPAFIVSHIEAMQAAMATGADVRGYYHWSLMDNFEWIEGYAPRFGLLKVDYTDPARPRSRTRGADALSAIIAAQGVDATIRNDFGQISRP